MFEFTAKYLMYWRNETSYYVISALTTGAAVTCIPRWEMMRVLEARPGDVGDRPGKKFGLSPAIQAFQGKVTQILR